MRIKTVDGLGICYSGKGTEIEYIGTGDDGSEGYNHFDSNFVDTFKYYPQHNLVVVRTNSGNEYMVQDPQIVIKSN